jgi:aminopeptidase N
MFRILRRWAAVHRGGTVSTSDFVALAEREADRNLSAFFVSWLYVAQRPAGY